jgi:uncharacterized coiled-coil protein SlyX
MSSVNQFAVNMEQFNSNLVDRFIKYNFRDYFLSAHKDCFRQVDISFMEEFLTIATKKEQFVISHEMLKKYGVINNTHTATNIKRCLDQFGFEDGIDYVSLNVERNSSEGGRPKTTYMLSQDTFKICLIRAKNSKKYAKYYLTLEKTIAFYYQYLDGYNAKLLTMKDDKIDHLIKENKEQSNKIDELLKQSRSILSQNIELLDEVHETKETSEHLEIKVEQLTDKVEDVREVLQNTLEDRNQRPESPKLRHQFVLLKFKNENNLYKVIRGQAKRVTSQVRRLSNTCDTIMFCQYDPNPIDMFNRFREVVRKDNATLRSVITRMRISREEKAARRQQLREKPPVKIDGTSITLNLDLINQDDFVNKINQCIDDKYNVAIP